MLTSTMAPGLGSPPPPPLPMPLSAQTADDIIARYIKTVGGMERIQAVTTLRRTGRFTGGGGFEATVIQESKRPNKVRQEFSLQGMTGDRKSVVRERG